MVLEVAQFADLLGAKVPEGEVSPATGVTFHSGRVRAGDAFFALPGASTHGIEFADGALEQGASFIVSNKPHPRGLVVNDPAEALLKLGRWARAAYPGSIVGITGSAGKTTTKAFLAAVLGAPSSPGNFNTPLALATTLVNTHLQSGGETKPLVLELGIDHVGEMAALVELVKPTHAVLTLVAASHLEELRNLGTVAVEKGKLLEAAIHRFASTQAASFLTKDLRQKVHTYGIAEEANSVGQIVDETPNGQTLIYKGVSVTLSYPGRGIATNAVGALCVAESLGVLLEEAAARLARVKLEPGRLETKHIGAALLLDDSYNSNPASATQALDVLRASPGPRTAILGDMLELGSQSATLHRELGEQTLGIGRVVAIGQEARHLVEGNRNIEHFASFGEALPLLTSLPLQGTILVKASRGMHFERVVEVLEKQKVSA